MKITDEMVEAALKSWLRELYTLRDGLRLTDHEAWDQNYITEMRAALTAALAIQPKSAAQQDFEALLKDVVSAAQKAANALHTHQVNVALAQYSPPQGNYAVRYRDGFERALEMAAKIAEDYNDACAGHIRNMEMPDE